jgi:hypothetical protein
MFVTHRPSLFLLTAPSVALGSSMVLLSRSTWLQRVTFTKTTCVQSVRLSWTALDVDYMKALEQGGDTAAIAAQKQALRDVTACPH